MRSSLWFISLAAALYVAGSAQAVTITNITKGTILFSDDFEALSPVSTTSAPDGSNGYDPIAQIGSWGVYDGNDASGAIGAEVQVTNSTMSPDPGAVQGSKYLRIYRDADFGANEVTAFVSGQVDPGDLLKASMMVYIPTGAANANARGQFLLGAAYPGGVIDVSLSAAWVRPDGAGNVKAIGPGFAVMNTGLTYTAGVWQEWDLSYVVGEGTYILSVGGVTSGPITSPSGFSGVLGLTLINGNGIAGSVYFDAVPSSNPAVPGDFDADGDVDGADFVAWQTHFPTSTGATLADGDADADGDVDGADFVVWQTNFPFTPGPGVASVPEPICFTLIVSGISTTLVLRRRFCPKVGLVRGNK